MSTAQGVAKVPQQTFLDVLWVGTGASFGFLFFRICVKIRSFRKIHSDDYLVIAAWLMLLGSAAIWQHVAPTFYEQSRILSGKASLSVDFFHNETIFLRCLGALNILFWTCLYCIKLSFLLFFRRLRAKVRGREIWWWCVLAVAVTGWLVSIADYPYRCIYSSFEYILSRCENKANNDFVNNTFYANCACDVLSDVLILSIPIIMLWKVRIPLRKKLALIGTFSVTIIVMVVAILRVTAVSKTDSNFDLSWVFLWNYIEMTTALILASVAAFRQLFVTSQQRQNNSGSSGPWTKLSALLSRLKFSRSTKRSASWPSDLLKRPESKRSPDTSGYSEEPVAPLEGIHIDRHVDVAATYPPLQRPPRLALPDLSGPPHFRFSQMRTEFERIQDDTHQQSTAHQ